MLTSQRRMKCLKPNKIKELNELNVPRRKFSLSSIVLVLGTKSTFSPFTFRTKVVVGGTFNLFQGKWSVCKHILESSMTRERLKKKKSTNFYCYMWKKYELFLYLTLDNFNHCIRLPSYVCISKEIQGALWRDLFKNPISNDLKVIHIKSMQSNIIKQSINEEDLLSPNCLPM